MFSLSPMTTLKNAYVKSDFIEYKNESQQYDISNLQGQIAGEWLTSHNYSCTLQLHHIAHNQVAIYPFSDSRFPRVHSETIPPSISSFQSCWTLFLVVLHLLITPPSSLTCLFSHTFLSSSWHFISKQFIFLEKSKAFSGIKKERTNWRGEGRRREEGKEKERERKERKEGSCFPNMVDKQMQKLSHKEKSNTAIATFFSDRWNYMESSDEKQSFALCILHWTSSFLADPQNYVVDFTICNVQN